MAVSTIEGMIEAVELKRVRGNVRVYDRVTFRLGDGTSKSIAKAVVEEKVAAVLRPGTSGRFYLYNALDHRGIHGVRDSEGGTVFGYARMNETAMLWVVGIALIMIVATFLILDGVSIWGSLLLILGVPAYFLYRKTRLEAERQFKADG